MWPLTVGQSTVSARSRCMQLACSSITQTAEHSRITGVRCAECKYTKQSNKPIEAQPSKAVASAWSRPSTVAPSVGLACLHYFLATSNAYAAKICLDVPGWLADPKDALFHSPVLAVGAAVLALVLFPKLIKVGLVLQQHASLLQPNIPPASRMQQLACRCLCLTTHSDRLT